MNSEPPRLSASAKNGHRLLNIQALRAVAVLLVVGRHFYVYLTRSAQGSPMPGGFLIGDMGVDLFFVISGFIMVVTHQTAFADGTDVARFLYRRASRIYPLYWMWSLPALAVYLWRPEWLHRLNSGMSVDVTRSLLLWPQPAWPLLGQAWSLVYELYFYVVFAALLRLPGKWILHGLLAWAGLVVAGNALLNWLPALGRPETWLIVGMLTLEFIAGALAGLAVRAWPGARRGTHGWVWITSGMIWIAAIALPLGTHPTGGIRVAAYGPPCVALVYGAAALEAAGVRFPRFLSVIGDWSYSIYLSHIFVIAALFRLAPGNGALSMASAIALGAGCVAAVLLVGALSYRCLERPLLWLTRRAFPVSAGNTRNWPARPAMAPTPAAQTSL